MMSVAKDVLELAKRCARGLHGMARRVFPAEVTREDLDGDARRAERVFGWHRKAVTKGLVEQAFGVELITPPDARGRPRSEDRYARLGQVIDAASLPNERTFRRMLNRRGFRLRRVQKTKPVRKIPQTDAIFANVARSREESRDDPRVLRIQPRPPAAALPAV